MAVDKSGRFYVCGFTISSDFFVFHPYQTLPQGGYDAFVTKFTHGPQPVFNYSTYLGGSLADVATSVAVDRDGRGGRQDRVPSDVGRRVAKRYARDLRARQAQYN